MDKEYKKRGVSLGIRIATVFILAVIAIFILSYYILSHNFHELLTDYTMKLLQAMDRQGVQMVESELASGKKEAAFWADSFNVPASGDLTVSFPTVNDDTDHLRMIYVTEDTSIASDGRERDIRMRQDIQTAFAGEQAVYGPYYNEEGEFVVCYSAPVMQDDTIAGVLSIEKDGYYFCKLIENLTFGDSGESYIINAEGTDIAVSDSQHIEWVTEQYNSQKLYAENADAETKSILDLELKGLSGESGIGSYYWHDGLCYLVYEPVPSVDWVLLTGVREEEIAAMTQKTLLDAIKGPTLEISLLLFILLTALICYWIITSMKKNAEINQRLETMANYDALTGLMNRNSYHTALDMLSKEDNRSLACLYIDANGLHEINNHLGHQAGDHMLKAIAEALREAFPKGSHYRIGGDEFVVLCWGQTKSEIEYSVMQLRKSLYSQNYEISIGVACRDLNCNVRSIVEDAETAMQQDKQQFYLNSGNERRMRKLNKQLEQTLLEKQDADTFLNVLATDFKGVYFVNMKTDTTRHLYIPPYFEELLQETNNQFSKALTLYAQKFVKPDYLPQFSKLDDYAYIQKKLKTETVVELIYQKYDGEWIKLRILKFKDTSNDTHDTLWIFANMGTPEESHE